MPHLDRTGGLWASLPNDRLRQWAAKEGPDLAVATSRRARSSLPLVTDSELSAAAGARQAPLPPASVGFRVGQAMDTITSLPTNVIQYPLIKGLAGKDRDLVEPLAMKHDNARREVVLSQEPFVMLQGDNLAMVPDAVTQAVRVARATVGARVSLITPDGLIYGLAHRIHYRAGQTIVVLEGNPSIKTARQYFKAADSKSVLILDFARRTVASDGEIRATRL